MTHRGLKSLLAGLVFAVASACFSVPAHADIREFLFGDFGEGSWRAEVAASTGFHSGRRSRTGDLVFTGNAEYEWPITARMTLGLRMYPLFLYLQDDPEETVWGGGVGIDTRYYFKEAYDAWYVEGAASLLGHDGKFEGNSGSMNFLLQAGVGYEFQNDWHVTLQVQHLSNGGLAERNAGANSVGVAVGYRF
ncbi:MAG: hypothetical protein AMXMBFR84_01770 [Candidatus Hydrogenedentota bacterium]